MQREYKTLGRNWQYSRSKTMVLAAASSVICKDGPRAATLKNIAQFAGITEPAIFRHFDGVSGLFTGLLYAYKYALDYFEVLSKTNLKGILKLRHYMLGIIDYLDASKDFTYVLINPNQVFGGDTDGHNRKNEFFSKKNLTALACIKEAISKGDLRSDIDPSIILSMFMGTLHSTVTEWLDSGCKFDLKKACYTNWFDLEQLGSNKKLSKEARTKLITEYLKKSTDPATPFEVAKREAANSPRRGRPPVGKSNVVKKANNSKSKDLKKPAKKPIKKATKKSK